MAKSQIYVAASDAASVLAEKLRNALTGPISTALTWQDAVKDASGTVIDALEDAAAKFDFVAIILLATDTAACKGQGGPSGKTRDDLVFEAGLFMGALGREHCFLVSSAPREDLPPNLQGIITLPFNEPRNLKDREECEEVLRRAIEKIKDSIERPQRTPAKNKILTLLSPKELLEKETVVEEGQVVVTAIQPIETSYIPALQVRKNLDRGVSYVYYFHANADGAGKICWLMQMVLLAPLLEPATANEFRTRQDALLKNRAEVLDTLRQICERQLIRIITLPQAPVMQYCIHNATNVDTAVAYLKSRTNEQPGTAENATFLQWARGRDANAFWNEVKQKYSFEPKPTLCLFYESAKLNGPQKDEFYGSIDEQIEKYFNGMAAEVRSICVDGIPRRR